MNVVTVGERHREPVVGGLPPPAPHLSDVTVGVDLVQDEPAVAQQLKSVARRRRELEARRPVHLDTVDVLLERVDPTPRDRRRDRRARLGQTPYAQQPRDEVHVLYGLQHERGVITVVERHREPVVGGLPPAALHLTDRTVRVDLIQDEREVAQQFERVPRRRRELDAPRSVHLDTVDVLLERMNPTPRNRRRDRRETRRDVVIEITHERHCSSAASRRPLLLLGSYRRPPTPWVALIRNWDTIALTEQSACRLSGSV
jgi:hypothetical protein